MWKTGQKTAVLAALLSLLAAAPARAHPHVWVDYQLTVHFQKGKIVRLDEDWLFDEDFTASVLHDVIHHGNGKAPFSAGEIAKMKESAFSNLKNYDYFTHVWDGKTRVKLGAEATDFQASMTDDQLRYRFTLPLPTPVDPHGKAVHIGIWDDTYYVDVGPAKGHAPVLDGDTACKAQVIEDKDHPIYYGSVNPQTVRITC